jgi:predicted amidohydrolase
MSKMLVLGMTFDDVLRSTVNPARIINRGRHGNTGRGPADIAAETAETVPACRFSAKPPTTKEKLVSKLTICPGKRL